MVMDSLAAISSDPRLQAAVLLGTALLVALITEILFRRVFLKLVKNTATQIDDIIVTHLRRPIFLTVVLIGISWTARILEPRAWMVTTLNAVLESIAVLLWAGALIRISSAVLRYLCESTTARVFQPQTRPLFDMLAKILIAGIAVYLLMFVWALDLTGWLASAGVVGLAVGFAARDSLANLFAGIFIIADAPYKVGHFIMFEDGLRGRVTEIGLRATRILTRDDIEINIPNQLIGNSRVINESAGPYEKERIQVQVCIAYGSDLDLVRRVLLECPKDQPYLCSEPAPHVIFREFGLSGAELSLCAWIVTPRHREDAVDGLNERVYKAFAAHGIEISHSKHDLYIKSVVGGGLNDLPVDAQRTAQVISRHV